MARERWETMTTWGCYGGVGHGDGWEYECEEPLPPDGDGWEPFASGFGLQRYYESRDGHASPDERPEQYIVWRRRVEVE